MNEMKPKESEPSQPRSQKSLPMRPAEPEGGALDAPQREKPSSEKPHKNHDLSGDLWRHVGIHELTKWDSRATSTPSTRN